MPFAVVKQRDVVRDDIAWAEWDGEDGGPVAHRTREGAERAMAALVPEGKDPGVYAGLRVIVTHEPVLTLDD